MIYGLYIFVCLILVVLQSTVFPVLLPPSFNYDLLLPLVVYLGLYHSPGRAIVPLLLTAFMMDSLTGGALGMYVLVYVWLYGGIRLILYLIERDNLLFIALAIVAGVVLEHVVFWLTGFFSGNGIPFGGQSAGSVIGRMVAAGLTGPFLLRGFKIMADRMTVRIRYLS